jgi:hypothetical protein
MRVGLSIMVTSLAVAMSVGCAQDRVTAPVTADQAKVEQGSVRQQAAPPGSGLVLNSLTGLSVPLIGHVGDVTINQAVITNFALVENTVGQIVGLEANGVLQLTGGVLGTNVVTENFDTTVSVTSSGPGQCDLITIDLGAINVDALGVASVDVPAATLTARGSGALGSLLCNLGSVLSGLTGGGAGAAGGLVNAINNLI